MACNHPKDVHPHPRGGYIYYCPQCKTSNYVSGNKIRRSTKDDLPKRRRKK
jgi:hypothetical protein